MAWSRRPNVSTRICRFLPLIFLPASYPGGSMRAPLVWGLGCQELKHGTNLFSFFCPLARWWRANHRPTPIDPASQAAAADACPWNVIRHEAEPASIGGDL